MRLQQNPDSDAGEMVELEIEGSVMRVHMEVAGPPEGPRLLVLHGWGASTELMRPILTGLSDTFRMAAIDFPGHGASPVPSTGYGMPGHLDVIRGVLNLLGWKTYGIVGHSNGGRAALTWAADNPEGLQYLALIAPSGIRRKRSLKYHLKSWTARILKAPFLVLPTRMRDFGLDWVRHSLVWRLLGSSDYRALEGSMRETFVQTVNHYVEPLLADIHVPVLVIRGENDVAITHDQVTRLVDGLKDGGLHTIPDAGHYAQLDQAGTVTNAIRSLASA